MRRELGIDLGTNSLAYGLREGDELIDTGVIVFPEGVKREGANEESKAARRTALRSARRVKFRRKLRKYETLLVLIRNQMCPLSEEDLLKWRKSGFKRYPLDPDFLNWLQTNVRQHKNPYYFRAKATEERISLLDLGRAFYHMAQRRGFISNRLDKTDTELTEKVLPDLLELLEEQLSSAELEECLKEYLLKYDLSRTNKDLNKGEVKLKSLINLLIRIAHDKKRNWNEKQELLRKAIEKKENLGKVNQGILELDNLLKEANVKTLGQYLFAIQGDKKIRGKYTSRERHYLKEFDIICRKQFPDQMRLSEASPRLRYSGVVLDLYRAIFFQRTGNSQKGLVGKCTLEPGKRRCQVSRPEYELYRMYSFVNNIRVATDQDQKRRCLTKEERESVYPLFYRKTKSVFPFYDIRKKIGIDYQYNFKDETTVSGCPTIASLISVFGKDWEAEISKKYERQYIRNQENGEVVRRKFSFEIVDDIWHVLNTFDSPDKLKGFGKAKLGLSEELAVKFSKISLKKDYANLGIKAIRNILPYLKKGLQLSHAIFMANMKNVIRKDIWEDEQKRVWIEEEVINIVDTYQIKKKINNAINSTLKYCKDQRFHYTRLAHDSLERDLNNSLIKELGERNWERFKVMHKGYETENFIKHLKKQTFVKNLRLDELINKFLEDHQLIQKSTNKKLYHPSEIEKFKSVYIKDEQGNKLPGLGSPLSDSVKNPMAMRALHQLRHLINKLILDKKVDEDTIIRIELTRELNDANKRKAIQLWQKRRETNREQYRNEIAKLIDPTNDERCKDAITMVRDEDVLKYQLWKEQNHICVYTGKTIKVCDFIAFNPSVDFEHTLPRSLSHDNSQENLTLSDSEYNRNIKRNKLASEMSDHTQILTRIAHWKKKYESLFKEIEQQRRISRSVTDKAQKDKAIQKRHFLQLEYDYWKGKYSRFVISEIRTGFKNSQYVDTGLITRYAVSYLKSVFKRVESVKGEMVAVYRKAWGIQLQQSKDRSSHMHHCLDAITIAFMDKSVYDKMAHVWALEDKFQFDQARKLLQKMKPWPSFAEDVRGLEKQILVTHKSKDTFGIQTRIKLRKRGLIQYTNSGEVIYQQGDGARGEINKASFYGAIKKPVKAEDRKILFDEQHNMKLIRDKNGDEEVFYVIRKKLEDITRSDMANIVDDGIRRCIEKAQNEGLLLTNDKGSSRATQDTVIWQNQEKGIPLKKVRVVTSLKNPVKEFKKHGEAFLSKKKHKQFYHVDKGENYCLAMYEGKNEKGKLKREFETVDSLEAAEYFRLSNQEHRKNYSLALLEKNGLALKYILRKGLMVLFYKENPEELEELSVEGIRNRLYKITSLESDGRLNFRFHQIALPQRSKNKDQMTITKYMKDNGLKPSKVDFETPKPGLRLSSSNWNFILEGVDFRISITGDIIKL